MGVDYDKALSATIMYHRLKKSVNFDSVSPKQFQAQKPLKAVKVEGIEQVLKSAIDIAFSGWNKKFWAEVTKN